MARVLSDHIWDIFVGLVLFVVSCAYGPKLARLVQGRRAREAQKERSHDDGRSEPNPS
jgi:hypothetical protein